MNEYAARELSSTRGVITSQVTASFARQTTLVRAVRLRRSAISLSLLLVSVAHLLAVNCLRRRLVCLRLCLIGLLVLLQLMRSRRLGGRGRRSAGRGRR